MISTGRGWSGHFLAGTTSLFFATARWWHTRRTFGFVDLAQKRELQWSERKEKMRKWYHRSSKINLPTHWIGKKSVKKDLFLKIGRKTLILLCPESGLWVIIKNIVKHSRNEYHPKVIEATLVILQSFDANQSIWTTHLYVNWCYWVEGACVSSIRLPTLNKVGIRKYLQHVQGSIFREASHVHSIARSATTYLDRIAIWDLTHEKKLHTPFLWHLAFRENLSVFALNTTLLSCHWRHWSFCL